MSMNFLSHHVNDMALNRAPDLLAAESSSVENSWMDFEELLNKFASGLTTFHLIEVAFCVNARTYKLCLTVMLTLKKYMENASFRESPFLGPISKVVKEKWRDT